MRKAIRRIVLAAAAVIFIVSCVNLFQIFSEYRRGEGEYGNMPSSLKRKKRRRVRTFFRCRTLTLDR